MDAGRLPEEQANEDKAKQVRLRKRVCAELVQTESAYLEQLQSMVTCYEEPLCKSGGMEEADRKLVFINVHVLVQIHQELSETLKAKLEGGDAPGENFAIGAALLSITPLLQFYKEFVNRYHGATDRLRELNATKKKFAAVLDKCKHGSATGGLWSLESLLISPVQRIPRYVLLLKEVLKVTPETHLDFAACIKALASLENVGSIINEARRQFESSSRLINIAKAAVNGASMPPLILAHRKLLEELAGVQVRTTRMESPGDAVAFEKRTLLLCNDAVCVVQIDQTVAPANMTPGTLKKSPMVDRKSPMVDRKSPRGSSDQQLPTLVVNERCTVIDVVSFSEEGIVIQENVAEELFSIANPAHNLLHTIRLPDKAKVVLALQKMIQKWRADVAVLAKEQEVTEKLQGISFRINGTVPVAPQRGKPYLMYLIALQSPGAPDSVILKKYSDLQVLHKLLARVYGEAAMPRLPPMKRAVAGTSPAKCAPLVEYLNGLMQLREVLKVPQLRQFLTTTDDKAVKSSGNLSGSLPMASVAGSGSLPLATTAASPGGGSNSNVEEVQMEGWLTKKGHKRRNWKRRWFVLTADGEVAYYAKRGAAEPKGTISLAQPGVSVITMEPSAASAARFMIITPEQLFPIYADCDKDRVEWMRVIEGVAAQWDNAATLTGGEEEEEVLEWGKQEGARTHSYIY